MAGVLACELGNSDKLSHFEVAAEMGILVLGPDVNESGENFTPVEGSEGDVQVPSVLVFPQLRESETSRAGLSWRSARRMALSKRLLIWWSAWMGRRLTEVLECLIKSGGFDALEGNRAALLADLDRAMGEAQLRRKDREAGQVKLFDLMGGAEDSEDRPGSSTDFSSSPNQPEVPEMEELEKLKLEKELLGFSCPVIPWILCPDWDHSWIR